jgi:hypothetical protein
MSLNKRHFNIRIEEYFLTKKETELNNPALASDLVKIFLLQLKLEGHSKKDYFFDGESDDSVLNKVDMKPFKRRGV